MAILGRAQILAANDIRTELVEVPEWGGEVLLRGLTGAERDAYELSLATPAGKKMVYHLKNMRARLVAMCVVDEQGRRVFEEGDVQQLGEKSGVALMRIWKKAQELSGLSDEDVEELGKNSESDQSDNFTSD